MQLLSKFFSDKQLSKFSEGNPSIQSKTGGSVTSMYAGSASRVYNGVIPGGQQKKPLDTWKLLNEEISMKNAEMKKNKARKVTRVPLMPVSLQKNKRREMFAKREDSMSPKI